MRFLANENVPGPVVAALRERDHDVFWIEESMPGVNDPVVQASRLPARQGLTVRDEIVDLLAAETAPPGRRLR